MWSQTLNTLTMLVTQYLLHPWLANSEIKIPLKSTCTLILLRCWVPKVSLIFRMYYYYELVLKYVSENDLLQAWHFLPKSGFLLNKNQISTSYTQLFFPPTKIFRKFLLKSRKINIYVQKAKIWKMKIHFLPDESQR